MGLGSTPQARQKGEYISKGTRREYDCRYSNPPPYQSKTRLFPISYITFNDLTDVPDFRGISGSFGWDAQNKDQDLFEVDEPRRGNKGSGSLV